MVMSTYVPYNRILFQRTLNVSGLYSKHNLHFLVFKLIRMMINGPIWSIHSSVLLNGSKNLFMTRRHIYFLHPTFIVIIFFGLFYEDSNNQMTMRTVTIMRIVAIAGVSDNDDANDYDDGDDDNDDGDEFDD